MSVLVVHGVPDTEHVWPTVVPRPDRGDDEVGAPPTGREGRSR
jgi:hypothetical protein